MLIISAAMLYEARAFIDCFNLKPDNGFPFFSVYRGTLHTVDSTEGRNDQVMLIVSGTGSVNSAAAIASLLTYILFSTSTATSGSDALFESSSLLADKKNSIIAVNIGICGCNTENFTAGSVFLINKICDCRTTRCYYPDIFFKHNYNTGCLECHDRPVIPTPSILPGSRISLEKEILLENEIPIEPEIPIETEIPIEPEIPIETDIPIKYERATEHDIPIEYEIPIECERATEHDIPIEHEIPLKPEIVLYDMESSGFFQSASKFLPPHSIQLVKVVSDNPATNMQEITKGYIELLCRKLPEMVLDIYYKSKEIMKPEKDNAYEKLLEEIGDANHMTFSMKIQFRKAALAFLENGGNIDILKNMSPVNKNIDNNKDKCKDKDKDKDKCKCKCKCMYKCKCKDENKDKGKDNNKDKDKDIDININIDIDSENDIDIDKDNYKDNYKDKSSNKKEFKKFIRNLEEWCLGNADVLRKAGS